MIINNEKQLEDKHIFTETNEILGCTNFEDLESKYDDLIFYADGEKQPVLEAMREEFHANPFECVSFDGWYIALLDK